MSTKEGINTALRTVGLAGYSGVVVEAPNVALGLGTVLKKTGLDLAQQQRILAELRRQGLVDIAKKDRAYQFTITPAGAHRLQQVMIDEIRIEIPEKWDKKWRLVTYDVPVKFSAPRQAFTNRLQAQGFSMLQRSLWVHPAPCFIEVEQIAIHYNIMRYCTLMEVDRLDEQSTQKLLQRFGNKLSI